MTFNQIAEIFAKQWSKDVNRTHIASIMRLREKSLIDPAISKKAKLFSSNIDNGDLIGNLVSDRNVQHITSSPVSGLDLFRLVDDDKTKQQCNKPVTSISILQNPSSSAVFSQKSSIFSTARAANTTTNTIQCETCSCFFDTQQQLISHILTTPDHLNGDNGYGAAQKNSFALNNHISTPNYGSSFNNDNICDNIKHDFDP